MLAGRQISLTRAHWTNRHRDASAGLKYEGDPRCCDDSSPNDDRQTSRSGAPASATLNRRQLNRATLARQMLLAREKTTALGAIERLVALQAQLARPPYVGLWTRVQGFKREDLTALVHARRVVRGTHLRGTLHLMSAKDFVRFRAVAQPALTAAMRGILRDRLKGFDLDDTVAAG